MQVDYAEVFQVGNTLDLIGFFPFLSSSLPRGTQTSTKKSRQESIDAPTTGYEICISAIATAGEKDEPQRFPLPSASSLSSTIPIHDVAKPFFSASPLLLSSSPSVERVFIPSTMVVVGTTTGDLIGFQRYPYSSSSSSCGSPCFSTIELMFFVHRYHYGPIYDIAVECRSLRIATAGHDAVCRLTSWHTLRQWYPRCEALGSQQRRRAVPHKGSAMGGLTQEDGPGEHTTHGVVQAPSTVSKTVHGGQKQKWSSSSSRVSSDEPEILSVCGGKKGKRPRGGGESPEWNATVAAVWSAMGTPPGVVVLTGHSMPVVKMQFTMDGRYVFSLSVDGHLREHALHGIAVELFGIDGACGGGAVRECASWSPLSSSSLSRLDGAPTSSNDCDAQAIASRDFFCTRVLTSTSSTGMTSRRGLMRTFVLSPDETFAVVAGEGMEWIDLRCLPKDGPSSFVGDKEEEDQQYFFSSCSSSSSFPHKSGVEGEEKNEWRGNDPILPPNGVDNDNGIDNDEREGRDNHQGRAFFLSPQQRTWWSCIEQHGGDASLSLSHSRSPSSSFPDPLATGSDDFFLSSLHITALRWLPWNACAASLSVSSDRPCSLPLSECTTYWLAGTVVGERSWKPQTKKDSYAEKERKVEAAPPSTSSYSSSAVGQEGKVPSPQQARENKASREGGQEDTLPTTTPSSVVLGELIWGEKPGCRIPARYKRGGGGRGESDGAAAPSWFSPCRTPCSCHHPLALSEDDGTQIDGKEEKLDSSPCTVVSPCWWMQDLHDHRATASLWREKNICPCAAAFPLPSSSSLIPTSLSSMVQHTVRRRGYLSTRGEVREHLRCCKRELHETCNFLFKKLKEEVAAGNPPRNESSSIAL